MPDYVSTGLIAFGLSLPIISVFFGSSGSVYLAFGVGCVMLGLIFPKGEDS